MGGSKQEAERRELFTTEPAQLPDPRGHQDYKGWKIEQRSQKKSPARILGFLPGPPRLSRDGPMHPIAPANRSTLSKSFTQSESFFPRLELPSPSRHKRSMEADKPAIRSQSRSLLIPLLLWLPSLLLGFAYGIYLKNPVLLDQALALAGHSYQIGKNILLFGILPLALLALLLYPPFFPWLRLTWERIRKKSQFDRKLAADLLTRLHKFETVPDLLQLGRLYLESGQYGMALPLLAKALEKEPDSPRPHSLIAQALYEMGRPTEALPHAMANLRLLGDGFGKAEARLLLAKILAQKGELQEALAQLENLHRESGENYESLFLEGLIYKHLGEGQESQRAFSKILQLGRNRKRRTPKQDWILAKAKMALLLKGGTFMGKDQ